MVMPGLHIPDVPAATFPLQSGWLSSTIDTLIRGVAGYCVLSGCAVTAQGSPNGTVAVAAGVAFFGSTTPVAITAATVGIVSGTGSAAADATNPRIDLVVVNNAGVLSRVAGTASTAPLEPALPDNVAPLAQIYVPATTTAILSTMISDRRIMAWGGSLSTIPANTQAGSYTLVLTDAGLVVEMNSTSATVVTIPTNATVAFPVGTVIEICRINTGSVTITPIAGVTMVSSGGKVTLTNQYSSASIRQRAANTWILVGDIA